MLVNQHKKQQVFKESRFISSRLVVIQSTLSPSPSPSRPSFSLGESGLEEKWIHVADCTGMSLSVGNSIFSFALEVPLSMAPLLSFASQVVTFGWLCLPTADSVRFSSFFSPPSSFLFSKSLSNIICLF
jgi:hypothetical protein